MDHRHDSMRIPSLEVDIVSALRVQTAMAQFELSRSSTRELSSGHILEKNSPCELW